MKRFLWMGAAVLGLAGLGLSKLAVASPHVEVDPTREYHITPEDGPWFICAASYRGETASSLAHEMVLEIRRKYNMPAFIFDHGREEREKQKQEVMRIKELTGNEGRVKIIRIEEQFAVLVGGYKDMAAARKALDDFKKLPLPDKKLCYSAITQEVSKDAKGQQIVVPKEITYSPFVNAFVAHNPTVAQERGPENWKTDPLLKKLNSGESLSLLNNSKPWTLTVKVFSGPGIFQERNGSSNNKFMEMLGMGKGRETLDAGAMQARALAETLRKMKDPSFEAYVLHTRTQSIVTVGGYDSPNDPRMIQDQQVLGRLKLQGVPLEFQLFAKPMPMEVPRP